MTDNEIIKAWENEIHLAEYVDSDYCSNVEVSLIKETINTFNRQKAEIKRLEEMLDSAVSSEENAVDTTNYMIAEAVKEFVDLAIKTICEKVNAPSPTESYIVEKCNEVINNLLKETVGDEK